MDMQGVFQAVYDPVSNSIRTEPRNPAQFAPTINTTFGSANGIMASVLLATPPARIQCSVIV